MRNSYQKTKQYIATLTLCMGMSAGHAAWPNDGPIRIIVPQAAGGTNDTVARIIGVELGKALKQTVIVDNRAGAGGAIGTQAMTQSKPDGYTLGLASDSASLLDVVRPTLSIKFKRNLRGLAMIGDQPISVSVSAKAPYKSVADIVSAAKARSGEIAYGTSGVGTSQHIVGEWFAKLASIKLIHVPYKGGGQATTDVVSGQVPLAVLGLAPMLAQEKNGGVRIVAVTSPQRHVALPNVPTLTELGFPQIALTQWAGLVAPRETPAPIVQRISDEMVKILAMPEVRKHLSEIGVDPRPMPAAQFDKFLQDTVDGWAKLVPTLNLKLD